MLSLWHRVHCERLRVAPCTFLLRSRGRLQRLGVFEVCCGCVAGAAVLCCGNWIRGVFCNTHGQRAFCVAGCRNRACWKRARSLLAGRVGGVMPWELGSKCVERAFYAL